MAPRYTFNVSRHGRQLFRTEPSIVSFLGADGAIRFLRLLREKFPVSDGYEVEGTRVVMSESPVVLPEEPRRRPRSVPVIQTIGEMLGENMSDKDIRHD